MGNYLSSNHTDNEVLNNNSNTHIPYHLKNKHWMEFLILNIGGTITLLQSAPCLFVWIKDARAHF